MKIDLRRAVDTMTTPTASTLDLEKAGAVTFDTAHLGSPTPSSAHHLPHTGHHYASRARQRLHHFLHPDSGKRIHVAASPEEAAKLRRHLAAQHEAHEFDVYISGPPSTSPPSARRRPTMKTAAKRCAPSTATSTTASPPCTMNSTPCPPSSTASPPTA